MRDLLINGHWAGVIALRRRVEKFLAGVCIVEIVLREKFRGRGYGPLVQRAAVTELALGDNEIVFGHIMDANKPAVNTALRVGRQPLGGYTFVRLV